MTDGRREDPVRWGILGTGNMARRFVTALRASRTGDAVAFGTRSALRGERFREQVGPIRCHVGLESLLADAEVEAVYVALPNSLHHPAAIAAAHAGKHVLCEKPLALTEREALDIVDATRSRGLFLMEGLMYRCHPQTSRVVELVRSGAIGRAVLIDVTLGYRAVFAPGRRVYSPELGGGSILDIGCYGVSVIQQLAGAGLGRSWAEPLEVKGAARVGPQGVDELATGIFVFSEAIVARISASITFAQPSRLQVYGTEGGILVDDPFRPAVDGGAASFSLRDHIRIIEQFTTVTDRPLLALQADVAGSCIRGGLRSSPLLPPAESVASARTLERWRSAAGVISPPAQGPPGGCGGDQSIV
jgi:predicted dehydrogenase